MLANVLVNKDRVVEINSVDTFFKSVNLSSVSLVSKR